MKPAPFEYWAPTSVDETLKLLSSFGGSAEVRLMAGGQSLMPLLNMRRSQPKDIIDLNAVGELAAIERDGNVLTIGAMCRQRTAERSAEVQQACPLIVEALHYVGHPQIRNRGTVGGSLAHADPAAELPTVAVCLDAELMVRGCGGERVLAAGDFFTGALSTALADDEILTGVRMRAAAPGSGAAFEEVARRHGDRAMVGVAVYVRLEEGVIAEASVALSGVGVRPVRAFDAQDALVGRAPSVEAFASAAAATTAILDPNSDLHCSAAYRKHVAGVLVVRALRSATNRAKETL